MTDEQIDEEKWLMPKTVLSAGSIKGMDYLEPIFYVILGISEIFRTG